MGNFKILIKTNIPNKLNNSKFWFSSLLDKSKLHGFFRLEADSECLNGFEPLSKTLFQGCLMESEHVGSAKSLEKYVKIYLTKISRLKICKHA